MFGTEKMRGYVEVKENVGAQILRPNEKMLLYLFFLYLIEWTWISDCLNMLFAVMTVALELHEQNLMIMFSK